MKLHSLTSNILKSKINIVISLLMLQGYVYAQADWAWAKNPANIGVDIGNCVAVDDSGNVYTVGRFSGFSLTFDSVTISNSSGNTNFFLVKHDAAGNVLWGRSVNGAANSQASCVAVDSAGNAYVGGYFNGNFPIGDTTLVNSNQFGSNSDAFFAKYDKDGNFIWARRPYSTGTEFTNCCTVDQSGNCIFSGSYSSTSLVFGNITLNNSTPNTPNLEFFIVKYDGAGNEIWCKSIGGSGSEYANDMCTDQFDNLYVVGDFSSPQIIIGNDTLNNVGTYGDIFVIKFDSLGSVVWTVTEGGNGSDRGFGITIDNRLNISICGIFQSTNMIFGTTPISSNNTQGNYEDAFAAQYDSSGVFRWVTTISGVSSERANGIEADQYGSLYVTGMYSSSTSIFGQYSVTNADNTQSTFDLFLTKCDTSGNIEWVKRAGGPEDDMGFSVAVDNNNTCTITGYFESNTVVFGNHTLINSGQNNMSDVYLAHIEDPLGISDGPDETNVLTVYPNPSSIGFVNVYCEPSVGTLRLTNSYGEIVREIKITEQYTLVNVTDLPAGIYCISVDDGHRYFRKTVFIIM